MKNLFRSALSAALAGLMAVSSLAACGGQADTAEEPEKTAAPESAAEQTEQETTTDYLSTLPETDMGGRKFTIVAQHTSERFNFPDEEKTGDVVNDAILERDNSVEERLNIKFDRLGYEDRGKLKTDVQKTILAGDDAYDLIITSMSDGINTLGPAGTLYDLNDLPHVDLTAPWWNRSIHDDMQLLGHQLFTTGAISPFYYLSPIVMLFNKRLAEDHSLGDLYALVNEGGWHFDKFISMAEDLSYDIDSNGKMDYDDFYGFAADTTFGNAMYAAAGLDPIKTDGETYTLVIDSEESVGVILRLADIFADKSRYNIFEGGADELQTMFKSGRCVFRSMNIFNFAIPYRDMEDDYGVIPLPKYKESDEDYNVICNTWGPTGTAVPITCKDPEYVGLVMETLAYTSYLTVGPAMYETALRGKATRDSESYEMLELIFRNVVFDLNTVFSFGGTSELLRAAVCGLKPNFVSDYEKIKPKAQKALDDMIALVAENYG
ncbi:MAG: extracellular solute-binding protein [Clostridiales bacterium]|nr:extracellular solute-binding protein [Clostridiales bacterium]